MAVRPLFDLKPDPAPLQRGQSLSCISCGLYRDVLSPRMRPHGEGRRAIMVIGEGPGCVSGDTFIEVAYRDKSRFPKGIPIRDLVGKAPFWVYSFDVDRQSLVLGKATKVWKTGHKPVYRVKYSWKFAKGNKTVWREDFMDVTNNHPFLLKRSIKHDPFLGHRENCDYLSIDGGLRVGHSLQPFLRSDDWVSVGGKGRLTEGRFLLANKLGRCIEDGEDCHHRNTNHIDDSWDNLEALPIAEHARVHAYLDNPMSSPMARKRHREAVDRPEYREGISRKLSAYLKGNPEEMERRADQLREVGAGTRFKRESRWATDGVESRLLSDGSLLPDGWYWGRSNKPKRRAFEGTNHKIVSVEYIGTADVYDMEVEKYHNFAAHGIFVHNSDEDDKGKPWQGVAGRTLRLALGEHGVDLDRDCVSLNAVNCRPPKNRTPTPFEISCCRSLVVDPAIDVHSPRLIMLMGGSAISSVLGSMCSDAAGAGGSGSKKKPPSVSKWRGLAIPVPELGAWICPTYHPSYVNREEKRPEIETVWRQDIRQAIGKLGSPVPAPEDLSRLVVMPRTEAEILTEINLAHGTRFLSHDYETTGLRPQFHRVICASFATRSDRAVAFMMPESGPVSEAWAGLMADPAVGKMSHNMKFENEWTRVHYGVSEINWVWDSMLGAHVVDNRPGICGLKLQAFVNFGIRSWEDEIEPYKSAVDKSDPRSPNRIIEFIETYGEEKCLVYCGIDSLTQFRLSMRQMEYIGA